MYVENKNGELDGDGRIGWVEMSKSGRSYRYQGRLLHKDKGGYKYNCIAEDNGDRYWVSGPSRDGCDKLYGGVVQIDEDAREAYWTEIRARPGSVAMTEYCSGSTTRTGGGAGRNASRERGGKKK
jgi:hypothetical protein